MAALGAALALLVTLIALTSAAARRDPSALAGTLAGIVRAGIGTGLLIALTTLALQVSDGISADVVASSHQAFWSQVGSAWGSSGFGGFGSSALAMLMAIVQLIAGVLVWLELAVRNAAIYLAVLFFPVALAASIWPTLAGWTSRLGSPAVSVCDSQAGGAGRARVRGQRGARRAGFAWRVGVVGGDDHRGDHDLRVGGDGAVGVDADRRGRRRVRRGRSRRSRRRGARGQRRRRDCRPPRRPVTGWRRARGGRVRVGRRRDPRRRGRQAGWGAGGVGRPEGRGRRAEPVRPVGRWAELPGRGTSAIFGRCRSRPRARTFTAAQRGGCRGSGDRGGRGRSRPDRNSTRTGVRRRWRGPDARGGGRGGR